VDDQTSPRNAYKTHIEPHLPPRMQAVVRRVAKRYDLWRLRPIPTRIRGPQWKRSREIVAVDITYECDLRCFNCNRSCAQDPSSDHMSTDQVRQFLEESRERGIRWKWIRVLGGEPTCHPDFPAIVDLFARFRDDFSPRTRITVITNGYSERARALVSGLPAGVEVEDTGKTTRRQSFKSFNVAPVDLPRYARTVFSNACPNTQNCGMGVTPCGYYPCATSGAIDRTFGLDLGRKVLPAEDDDMKKELETFCGLCGLFKREVARVAPDGPVMSRTWTEAYERSRKDPARLSRLAERDPRS
jgi:Radical SAM superfamily/4Fe-4S single cluster domain